MGIAHLHHPQEAKPKRLEEIALQISNIQRRQNRDKNLVLAASREHYEKNNNRGGDKIIIVVTAAAEIIIVGTAAVEISRTGLQLIMIRGIRGNGTTTTTTIIIGITRVKVEITSTSMTSRALSPTMAGMNGRIAIVTTGTTITNMSKH